jgi:hypothetical protein
LKYVDEASLVPQVEAETNFCHQPHIGNQNLSRTMVLAESREGFNPSAESSGSNRARRFPFRSLDGDRLSVGAALGKWIFLHLP